MRSLWHTSTTPYQVFLTSRFLQKSLLLIVRFWLAQLVVYKQPTHYYTAWFKNTMYRPYNFYEPNQIIFYSLKGTSSGFKMSHPALWSYFRRLRYDQICEPNSGRLSSSRNWHSGLLTAMELTEKEFGAWEKLCLELSMKYSEVNW